MMKHYYPVTSIVFTSYTFWANARGGKIMAKKRITADMSIDDMVVTMSEGNPGALTCMVNMLNYNPMALLDILFFDTMEIYGSKIYMLWNDCCGRDMDKFNKTIQYIREGKVSKEKVHENLNRVCAEPFI